MKVVILGQESKEIEDQDRGILITLNNGLELMLSERGKGLSFNGLCLRARNCGLAIVPEACNVVFIERRG